MTKNATVQDKAINTIRTLAMDAIQKANSGHPGTPMALAPVAYHLWTQNLRYDPSCPMWPNRDRFVLSCGHASMLIYALIHLAGIRHVDGSGQTTQEPALSLEELKNFRQWASRTPGHPEYGHATGVETTTGPLGQGCGNSVGMALAGRWLGSRYNQPEVPVFDYNVYALCSDGDLMEGVACEAASLAGHLQLDNLCWIYDDNRITIEGETRLAFSEDVGKRFEGLGWHVVRVDDANDLGAIQQALEAFQDCRDRPTLIVVRSVIAYGAPNKANTAGAHGAPLGDEEIRLTKAAYGWPENEQFLVPAEVLAHFQETLGTRGRSLREQWDQRLQSYTAQQPQLAKELQQMSRSTLPAGWDEDLPTFDADQKGMATRKSSGSVLNALAARIPWLIGGSADLAPSTNTLVKDAGDFLADSHDGRNFRFGIREHGMAAAANGMALCHLRPYAATFFVFSDYLRPSMRLAALMGLPVIYVLTHDSIGLGEDGPTHQPVEHLAAVRAIPNLLVIRPADANEVREAWKVAMRQTNRPVALVLTRQNVPTLSRDALGPAEGVQRGGYVLADAAGGKPEVLLVATGSEVSLAVEAHTALTAEGIAARVVSLPCSELFAEQEEAYRNSVLPPEVDARVAVEAGICQGWEGIVGASGRFLGLDTFGTSAPYETIFEQRGITTERIVASAKELLGK